MSWHSLAAVGPSLELLGQVGQSLDRPVWLNGDILPGPCGSRAPLDARAFLDTVTSSCPDATLSLGWTTGCHQGKGKGRAHLPLVSVQLAGWTRSDCGTLSCAQSSAAVAQLGENYILLI